jgi:hypothetical protein
VAVKAQKNMMISCSLPGQQVLISAILTALHISNKVYHAGLTQREEQFADAIQHQRSSDGAHWIIRDHFMLVPTTLYQLPARKALSLRHARGKLDFDKWTEVGFDSFSLSGLCVQGMAAGCGDNR